MNTRRNYVVFLALIILGAEGWVLGDEKPDAGKTGSLEIKLKWPEGIKPAPIGLLLISEDNKKEPVRSLTALAGREWVFKDVPPGNYILESLDAQAGIYGVEVFHKVRVKAGKRVEVEASVKRVKTVKMTVTLINSLTRKTIPGRLTVWRRRENSSGYEISSKGSELALISGGKYFFLADPHGSAGEDKQVGPFDPAQFTKRGLRITCQMKQPTIVYHWDVQEADRNLVDNKKSKVFPRLLRIDANGERQNVDDRLVYEHRVGLDGEVPMSQKVYNVPDGTYELSAKIAKGSYYTNVLTCENPAQFVVKNGKADPPEIKLMFSSKNTGTCRIQVLDKTGKRLPNALVELVSSDVGCFWSAKTDKNGEVVTPRLAFGEYRVSAFAGKPPKIFKKVVLKSSEALVTMGFEDVVDVQFQIQDENDKSIQTEGSCLLRGDISRSCRFGNKNGKHTIQILKDDFPVLMYAYAWNKGSPPSFVSALWDTAPKEIVTLRVQRRPARKANFKITAKEAAAKDAYFKLWLTPKCSVTPVGIVKLRPSLGKDATNKADEVVLSAETNMEIAGGDYELLLFQRNRSRSTCLWLGTVSIPTEGKIDVALPMTATAAGTNLVELQGKILKKNNPG